MLLMLKERSTFVFVRVQVQIQVRSLFQHHTQMQIITQMQIKYMYRMNSIQEMAIDQEALKRPSLK